MHITYTINMIETYLLEYFVTVYDEGNLLKASDKLHVSQPSITRALQKLESDLYLVLFDRKPNKITPNENAQILYEYAKDILNLQNRLVEKAKEIKEKELSINFGLTAPGPLYEFSDFIFNAKQHKVNYKIEEEKTLINEVKKGLLDFAFINNEINESELEIKKVLDEHLYIVLPTTHFLAKYEGGVTFKDTDGQTFLILNNLGIWDDIAKNNLPKSNFIHLDDDNSLRELVSASSIPSFSTNVTSAFRALKDKVVLPFLDKEATVSFYIIYKKKNEKTIDKMLNLRQSRNI